MGASRGRICLTLPEHGGKLRVPGDTNRYVFFQLWNIYMNCVMCYNNKVPPVGDRGIAGRENQRRRIYPQKGERLWVCWTR